VVVAAASIALCAGTGIAQAHIAVSPASAPGGTFVALTFRVPNERARTDTTSVVVALPRDKPVAAVTVSLQQGWHFRIATRHLSVPLAARTGPLSDVPDTITWSGGTIKPHESHTFSIRVGPLPLRSGPLYFKALQRYANGEVVRWIDRPQPGEDEPPNPAPVLLITATAGKAD
jgi:uncharacterized protein YcnI